jgi:hypothetical protein
MACSSGLASPPAVGMIRTRGTDDSPHRPPSLAELLGEGRSAASSTPNARNPFQVNATVTQRESRGPEPTAFPLPTFSRMVDSQVRARAGSGNVRNS